MAHAKLWLSLKKHTLANRRHPSRAGLRKAASSCCAACAWKGHKSSSRCTSAPAILSAGRWLFVHLYLLKPAEQAACVMIPARCSQRCRCLGGSQQQLLMPHLPALLSARRRLFVYLCLLKACGNMHVPSGSGLHACIVG